ncbi:TlpA disulfide reductase family protein [Natronospira bacteriovora]|uniref:TlpA disulfide reductase family protein n=1 Tax=Natronospira bacteriovora TaxID=3069753 RepID=A0ABU0W3T7_9GAMM|nr:TlpA disulfide reductase family protein [Natronospira sp. AB-CW4]MDQ2068682.1 TlpA disulfide reductase family protein [Natronospira sp. AB-CW4]
MDAVSLGPLVLPLDRLLVLLVAGSLMLSAWLLQRRAPRLNDWVTWSLIAAIVGGRLLHVGMNAGLYLDAPWQALYLWRDGYSLWGAVLGLLAVTTWYLSRRQLALRWVAAAATPALLLAVVGVITLQMIRPQGIELEGQALQRLDSEPVLLTELQGEAKTGVFLWATWCGVCRQMMPDVIEAARREPDSRWLLVNLGESPRTVHDYRQQHEQHGPLPDNLEWLLDPRSRLLDDWQALGVPTTVLFDADGRQQDRFMGQRALSRLLAD